MIPDSAVSRIVMRRVRAIHMLRMLAPVLAASSLFSLALYGIGREVWVAKVFENMPPLIEIQATLAFFLNAFMQTDFTVQTLSVLTIAALIFLAASIARNLRAPIRLA